jgi:hypothetical protein
MTGRVTETWRVEDDEDREFIRMRTADRGPRTEE